MSFIEIGHGSGGSLTRDLIENIFLKYLRSDELIPLEDAATVSIGPARIAVTTDSYVIRPLFFPGGDIGKLAVCGTVNDLAVSGAVPRYLSVGLIIEEGFSIEGLERIIQSISETAANAGVKVVTGDTKVVEKNKCDGIYINTTGIGEILRPMPLHNIAVGDAVIVTGNIGDHGTAIAISRNEFNIEAEVESDCAAMNDMLLPLLERNAVKWMRDPTRGGVATVLVELSRATALGVRLFEDSLPVRQDVRFIQNMLGYDPLYLANEGKAVIITSREQSDRVIDCLKMHRLGVNASVIGEITSEFKGVRLVTAIGGERVLDMLEEDMLPRIC